MQGLFTVVAPANWFLVKQNVLRDASGLFKVQVPHWTPFCYCFNE